MVDRPADDGQEPLAAGPPRGLGRRQRRVVAGILAELVEDPVGDVHGRVEEEDRPQQPLQRHDPEVPPADVGQLVEQDPVELFGGEPVVQVGRHHDGRPEQAADGRRGDLGADGPADGPSGPRRSCTEGLEVDREPVHGHGLRAAARRGSGGSCHPGRSQEPGRNKHDRDPPPRASISKARGRQRGPWPSRPGVERSGRVRARAPNFRREGSPPPRRSARGCHRHHDRVVGLDRGSRARTLDVAATGVRPGSRLLEAARRNGARRPTTSARRLGSGMASFNSTRRNSPCANWADILRLSGSQARSDHGQHDRRVDQAPVPMNDWPRPNPRR